MSTELSLTRQVVLRVAALLAGVVLTGCGPLYAPPGAGTDSGATLSITEPGDNATVTQPFTLKVESSAELGPTDSGKHHVHLSFDGNADDYTVEPDGELIIDQLSPGRHTIKVTLQHADHSSAGAEDELTVMVADGAAPTTEEEDQGSGSDGYDY